MRGVRVDLHREGNKYLKEAREQGLCLSRGERLFQAEETADVNVLMQKCARVLAVFRICASHGQRCLIFHRHFLSSQ